MEQYRVTTIFTFCPFFYLDSFNLDNILVYKSVRQPSTLFNIAQTTSVEVVSKHSLDGEAIKPINGVDGSEAHHCLHLYIKAPRDAISFRQITLRRFLSSAQDHFSFVKPPHLYFFRSCIFFVCVDTSFTASHIS